VVKKVITVVLFFLICVLTLTTILANSIWTDELTADFHFKIFSNNIPTITWSNPSNISYGTPLSSTQLDATASIPGTFVYNPPSGTILGVGMQTLSTIFTPTDIANYTIATANVSINVTKATPTINWSNPANITYGTALSSTQLDATTSVPGNFVHNPIAGTVLGVGTHTLSTIFTPTDSANYTTASASVSINVTKVIPTITWNNPANITYGTKLSNIQLNATSPVAGSFVYNPPAKTVLNAGQNQQLNTVFTPTDITNYTTASASVFINVTQVTPTITWNNPKNITYGTPLSNTQLNAKASVPGTFTYNPAAGAVLNAGENTLSVTFTPTDYTDYATVTTSVSININQAIPTITWSKPAAITYGTPLSNTQLDATASVPGTLVYNPIAGTVLSIGQNTLSVTFTPTDSTNYTKATANVKINVKK